MDENISNEVLQALGLLGAVHPIRAGIAEHVAKGVQNNQVGKYLMNMASEGTGPLDATKMLIQNQAEMQQAELARADRSKRWEDSIRSFYQFASGAPEIPEAVHAHLSEPETAIALLTGLLGGGFDKAAKSLGAAQAGAQSRADRTNKENWKRYEAEIGSYRQQGGLLNRVTDLSRRGLEEADKHLRGVEANGLRGQQIEFGHEEKMQRLISKEVDRASKEIDKFRADEMKIPVYGEEHASAREAFIQHIISEYGDAGLTEEDVRAAMGARREIGSQSVPQQNAITSKSRLEESMGDREARRLHGSYRGFLNSLKHIDGGVTEAHRKEAEAWIRANVPERYRGEFILPVAGESYQSVLGRAKAAESERHHRAMEG